MFIYNVAFQTARDTAANWTANNPILSSGEFGYETDTGKFKIGNGTTAWASLVYQGNAYTAGTDITITSGAISVTTGSFAALAGLSTQLFSAADGTTGNEVINYSQIAGFLTPYAPLASPTLTGTPTTPTATVGTNTTQIASTAFVQAAVTAGTAGVSSITGTDGITPTVLTTGAVTLGLSAVPNSVLAGILLDGLTVTSGVGLSVTNPASGVGTANIDLSLVAGTGIGISGATISNSGILSVAGSGGVTASTTSGATSLSLASVPNSALAGNLVSSLTAGTGITTTNPTGVGAATVNATAYTAGTGISVTSFAIANTGVLSFNGETGAVTPASGDYSAFYAPLVSPALTGTPTAPTATVGTDTTQIATTAFVLANAASAGVSSITGTDGITPTVLTTGAVTLGITADTYAPYTGSTNYATLGANSDITSLTGLTTPLSLAQGGTGATTAAAALTALGGAALAGSSSQVFNVANGVSGNEAINYTQFQTALAYDFVGGCNGKPTASQILLNNVLARTATLPISLTGSYAVCGTAPTAAATLTITQNGTSIGSINFAAAATSGTFTFAAAVTFALGDKLQVTAPATADTTFADITFTLAGTV